MSAWGIPANNIENFVLKNVEGKPKIGETHTGETHTLHKKSAKSCIVIPLVRSASIFAWLWAPSGLYLGDKMLKN